MANTFSSRPFSNDVLCDLANALRNVPIRLLVADFLNYPLRMHKKFCKKIAKTTSCANSSSAMFTRNAINLYLRSSRSETQRTFLIGTSQIFSVSSRSRCTFNFPNILKPSPHASRSSHFSFMSMPLP